MFDTFYTRFSIGKKKNEEKNVERLRMKRTTEWDEKDVLYFLDLISLSQYKDQFKRNHVDGEVLLDLDDHDFNALTVFLNDQRKLKSEIDLLKKGKSKYSFNSSEYVAIIIQVNSSRGVEENYSFYIKRNEISFDILFSLLSAKAKNRKLRSYFEHLDSQNDVIAITKNDHLHILVHTLYQNNSEIYLKSFLV